MAIHPKLLFELRHELAKPIAELFSESLSQGRCSKGLERCIDNSLIQEGEPF